MPICIPAEPNKMPMMQKGTSIVMMAAAASDVISLWSVGAVTKKNVFFVGKFPKKAPKKWTTSGDRQEYTYTDTSSVQCECELSMSEILRYSTEKQKHFFEESICEWSPIELATLTMDAAKFQGNPVADLAYARAMKRLSGKIGKDILPGVPSAEEIKIIHDSLYGSGSFGLIGNWKYAGRNSKKFCHVSLRRRTGTTRDNFETYGLVVHGREPEPRALTLKRTSNGWKCIGAEISKDQKIPDVVIIKLIHLTDVSLDGDNLVIKSPKGDLLFEFVGTNYW